MTNGIKEFGQNAQRLARNPLGIIALFLVLVYGIATIVAISPILDHDQRQIIIYFIIIFSFSVLGMFYLLVTKHPDKLYAPSDFVDEANFMRIFEIGLERSPKFSNLEGLTKKIQKEIDEQPLYRYTRLSEAGKRIILRTYSDKEINLADFSEDGKVQRDELKTQVRTLSDDYGWINIDGDTVRITEKGKNDVATFEDLCYGRYRGLPKNPSNS